MLASSYKKAPIPAVCSPFLFRIAVGNRLTPAPRTHPALRLSRSGHLSDDDGPAFGVWATHPAPARAAAATLCISRLNSPPHTIVAYALRRPSPPAPSPDSGGCGGGTQSGALNI